MTIDPTSFEERRYTRQHDRVFHVVVRQVQELDARLRYLEGLLEPRSEETSPEIRAVVADVRESSANLAETIETIGESLEAVVAALDTSHHPAAATAPTPPVPPPTPTEKPSDEEDVVVDLDIERRRKPAWRGSDGRQPGWMPVTNP